jgi:regulator of protease activity HflC (stomatin/prohibitin superfamily)
VNNKLEKLLIGSLECYCYVILSYMNFDFRQLAKRVFNTSLAVSSIGVFFIVVFLWSMCFVYVKPYEFGVKERKIGVERGIEDHVYGSGYHFVIPRFEKIYRFPKKLLLFDLTNAPQNRLTRNDKAVHIQTSDGFFVDVDVSILYRIQDPLKVIRKLGTGEAYITDGIAPKAEPILKETLGKLTTEEFYNPYSRVEKMLLAKEQLQIELEPKGLVVEEVLIRYFKYSDEIQRSIEDKKLKDQLVFKNQSEAKAAIENALLSKTITEGEANIKIELEKGKAYIVKKNAARDLYVRAKKARANLLVKKAEAEKARLKNLALKGLGSKNMVGLKMAEVLEGIEIIVLPSDGKDGVNPLNLDKVMGLF